MWNVSHIYKIGGISAYFVRKPKICCTLISVAGSFLFYDKIKAIITRGCQVHFFKTASYVLSDSGHKYNVNSYILCHC